jgi:hypothetical protein
MLVRCYRRESNTLSSLCRVFFAARWRGVSNGIELHPVLSFTRSQLQTNSISARDSDRPFAQALRPVLPPVCIPPPPPDLDCADVPFTNFKVLPPGPHRFAGDKNGVGCGS